MKELEDLKEDEKAVLLACCYANKFSLSSHVPIEGITKIIKTLPSTYVKKAIKTLLSNAFIIRSPTRGKMTYRLSKYGLKAGNKLK